MITAKKVQIFFGALRAPNFKISEVLINSSVGFSYFSEVLCSMGGVINSITVVVNAAKPLVHPSLQDQDLVID